MGPISDLWEWDQDENHHQAQLDICTQFWPNPSGSQGAGIRQTDIYPILQDVHYNIIGLCLYEMIQI